MRLLGCFKNPATLLLTAIIPLLVIACHCVAMAKVAAKQPPHLKEILDELSAIRIPTGKVVPNHANTKLLYLKYTTNDTWAIYLLDVTSGKSKLVREVVKNVQGVSEVDAEMNVAILGWSPQDEYFAYARDSKKEIVICDGHSGAELGKLKKSVSPNVGLFIKSAPPQNIWLFKKSVSTSAWLSSRSLLCSDGDQIDEFSQSPKGWSRTVFYKPPQISTGTNALTRSKILTILHVSAPTNGLTSVIKPPTGKIRSLAAFGLDSVVWQQANALYVCERGGAPDRIWQRRATNCTLLEFSFSSEANKFLLHCKDKDGEFLADFYPRILSGNDAFTHVVRLDTSEYQPSETQLINDGKGYAYLNQDPVGLSKLVIKVTSSSPPVELPWQDEVSGFSINGLQLYGITSSDGEPPGIWKCDLLSGESDCLASSIEQPFKYAAHVPVQEGYVTNTIGKRLTYYLLQPTVPNGNQKHPLVVGIMGIGEPGYTWDRLAQTIANCGGYFVCMDRRKRSQDQWADDAFCAYEFLSKNFAVDTNNVYLLGISSGAYTAYSLLESKPDIWNGAILFSMLSFPTLYQIRVHSIALDVGGLGIQEEEKVHLFKSRDQLAAAGIRPILTLHPDAGHIVRSIRFERERMEQIAAYIRQP